MYDLIIGFWSSPWVGNYILIGILFMLLMDILVMGWLPYHNPQLIEVYRKMGLKERALMIIIWPYLIYSFIKGTLNDKND